MKIDEIMKLKVGETVNYSGELIVMRDAAQRKLRELIAGSKEIPVYLGGKIVFYAGPAKPP
ncbi:MAG: fumarate hydratase C-terminal domain-containing protein, partial [Defluviitoga tunisiensis]